MTVVVGVPEKKEAPVKKEAAPKKEKPSTKKGTKEE